MNLRNISLRERSGAAKFWCNHRTALLMTFIACGISLAYFWITKSETSILHGDSNSYLSVAGNLKGKGMFSADGIQYDAFRTPGYPLIIAAFLGLGLSGESVVFAQILLMAATAFAIYIIVRMVTKSEMAGLLANLLFFLDIAHYSYDFMILSETLFYSLLVFSLLFFCSWLLQGKRTSLWILFSLILNYALLTRPILQYFMVLVVIALLVALIMKKVNWKHFLIFTTIFMVCFGGWSFRNYLRTGDLEYSSVRNYNLLMYDGEMTYAQVEGCSLEEGRAALLDVLDARYPGNETLSKSQRQNLMGQVGSKYIGEHIPAYLIVNLRGVVKMMIGPGRGNFIRAGFPDWLINLVVLFESIMLVIVYLIYASGLLGNIRKLKLLDLSLLLLIGYMIAASASVGSTRLRTAFMPMIIIGAICSHRFDDWAFLRKVTSKMPVIRRIHL